MADPGKFEQTQIQVNLNKVSVLISFDFVEFFVSLFLHLIWLHMCPKGHYTTKQKCSFVLYRVVDFLNCSDANKMDNDANKTDNEL